MAFHRDHAPRRFAITAACWILTQAVPAQCPTDEVIAPDPQLDEQLLFVRYTNDPSSADFTSDERAHWVLDAAVDAHNSLIQPPFNFPRACFGETWLHPGIGPIFAQSICIFDIEKKAGAQTLASRIHVDAPRLQTRTQLRVRASMIHEWFHAIQWCHIDYDEWQAWGEWTVEATADVVKDKVFTDIDISGKSYLGKVNNYLDAPDTALTGRSYDAALFWVYLSEQLGSPFAEPAVGVDFVHAFWERTDGKSPDSIRYLGNTIDDLRPSGSDWTIKTALRDFAITCYVRHLDLNALSEPNRYRFLDELQPGATAYEAVRTVSVPSVNSTIVTKQARWSAQYFVLDTIDVPALCSAVGIAGSLESGKRAYWVLLGLKDGGNRVARAAWQKGDQFSHAFLTSGGDPIDQLVAILVALENTVSASISFGQGPAGVEIITPNASCEECVGLTGGRFRAQVKVTGPAILNVDGQSSLSGLRAEDFRVSLISNVTGNRFPVEVSNVQPIGGGDYGLTCWAPGIVIADEGEFFDLRVCICPSELDDEACGPLDISNDAIRYAECPKHELLVVDISLAMGAHGRLDAAKNMASWLASTTQAANKMGLVVFLGDASETPFGVGVCNEDAGVIAPLADMADDANRDALVQLIDDLEPDFVPGDLIGWTSVGDGLKIAVDEFLAPQNQSGADKRSIYLMTGGPAEEGGLWHKPTNCDPAVRDLFDPSLGGPAAGITIHAKGFGRWVAMDVLQDMGTLTGGTAEEISEAEGEGEGGALRRLAVSPNVIVGPDTEALELHNRLAEAFRQSQEEFLGLDRLFLAAVSASAQPTTVTIPITESEGGGIVGAVFGFNWPTGASVMVELKDAGGVVVTDAAADWTVVSPPGTAAQTNVAYHFGGVLPPGCYEATISAAPDAEVLCVVSGRILRGVDTRLDVLPTQTDEGFCAHLFGRGYPARIVVNANDQQGGVAAMDLVAVIRNPDGSINRRTLFDDGEHQDGAAGDGVYANTYPRTPFARPAIVDPTGPPPPLENQGTYNVNVAIEGTNNYGETFQRHEGTSFTVIEDDLMGECDYDTDGDGMPDRWENLVGLDPTDPTDADLDNDNEGLINLDEFHFGTHPFDPDSDRGGESDGSEISAGRDPLWEVDDDMPPIWDYGVFRGLGDVPPPNPQPADGVRIRFPASDSYQTMFIYRSTVPDPAWSDFTQIAAVDVHNTFPRGLYDDSGLTPHVVHYYYLAAEGLSGQMTGPSEIFSAVVSPPGLQQPGGSLRINCGGGLEVDTAMREWVPDTAYLWPFQLPTGVNLVLGNIDASRLSDPDVPQGVLRVGRNRDGDIRYGVWVPDGEYRVTLYFSENCPQCVNSSLGGIGCAVCGRDFSIRVEDRFIDSYRPADAALLPPDDGAGVTFTATEVNLDVVVDDRHLDIFVMDKGAHESLGDAAIQAIAVTSLADPILLRRGDCNGDGSINLADALFLFQYMIGGPQPSCIAECDFNADGDVGSTVLDPIYLLVHLFLSGSPPPPPFPNCGPATASDLLVGCDSSTCM